MNRITTKAFSLFIAFTLALGLVGNITQPVSATGTISLSAFGTTYTQNFNTLAYNVLTSSAVPTGWDFSETGGGANANYRVSYTGLSFIGDTYSYGANNNSERSFGGLRGESSGLVPTVGASFTNNTGGTITDLSISFTGEEWRLWATGRIDRLDFQLSTDATSLTTGSWTDYNSLDFTAPVTTGIGVKNGNVAPNRTAVSYTITGLMITNGSTFWIRWQDFDASKEVCIFGFCTTNDLDDALAVDDFSLTPSGFVPDTAPSVSSVVPADGASNVSLNADLTVTFGEAVDLTGSWFDLTCSDSGNHTALVSGGPISFTLNQDTGFTANETCTLTVYAANVEDQDANDPPGTMAADFTSGFIVADEGPSVTSTTPTDGDINVPINSSITIDFSEAVTVTETSFDVTCASSGIHTFLVSGSATATITIDPVVNFTHSELCTLTVYASNTSDSDSIDPPDTMQADYTVSFTTIEAPPYIISVLPLDVSTLVDVRLEEIKVIFNKDVLHDGSENAADNTANYLLVENGIGNLFDTLTCSDGVQPNDIAISIDSVVYDPLAFTATLSINGGAPLPGGEYRFFVCGTTSVQDVVGNKLNNGEYDTIYESRIRFSSDAVAANEIPATGFATDRITMLPEQTVKYTSLGNLWLEIPRLKVKTSIIGVPQTGNTWDVTLLGSNAGWLAGSAYPTALGNSVLTAHVWDALNKPGAFYALDKLGYGDRIIVHSYGRTYTYEVWRVMTVSPTNVDAMLYHQEDAWLTLVTCKGYNASTNEYNHRILVRAVLVDMK